jgi:histidinol phosphatase-like enzyme (inositol monophosphatase family)
MLPDIAFLDELADAAARETLPRFRSGIAVTNKLGSGFDPVTEADQAAERAIRELIGRRFPGHGILGEEHGGENTGHDRLWVIDPIDGTRAFISGLPVWGTLIGFYESGRAVLGLMDQPFTGERFIAGPEGALYRRGGEERPLRTRDCGALADATLFTTSPALHAGELRRRYDLLEGAIMLPRYGCDCYAFAMLAAGHVDLVVESGLKPYDIAALIPIVEQAGGIVTTWEGGRAEQGGNIVAAGCASVHAEALAILGG